MTTRAQPKLALRPYLPADAEMLKDIFRSAIEDLTSEDYTPSQQDAWAAAADEESFEQNLGSSLTLLATLEGTPVGFASLKNNSIIDMLYVHPAIAGQGVGTMLIDALEKLANARGANKLTTDASDTSRPFFEKRGYVPQQRNSLSHGDEWLANTTMVKQLSPQERPS